MLYKIKILFSISSFRLILCTLIFLFCLCKNSSAQQQAYFNNLTEKDGLSNNSVTCFYKDKTGYMWIGTESGLNLYNGNSWKIYKPSLQKKNYLSNSFITDIEEDSKGSMWVCTRKGLNRIDVNTGTTEVFLPGDDTSVNTIPNDLVWDSYPESDTCIWIAVDAKEFCHYNPVVKKFYYYSFRAHLSKNNIESQNSYHSIFRILPKSSTELWLATTDGIFSFNKQTGEFVLKAAIKLSEITFFYFDEKVNELYCAVQENKLYCFNPSKKEITVVSLQRRKHKGKFNPPYAIDEKLLLVPAEEGLAAINEKNEVLYFLSGNTGKENDLLPGKVNCIYKDRQHITWVGTMNGISKFIPVLNNNLNLSFPNNLTLDPYLSFKNFMYHVQDNEWFIASWKDNKIFVANNKTGKITTLKNPAVYRFDTCYAFYAHNADSVFFLSGGSILTYNYRFKKWGKIIFPPPYNKFIITSMAIDPAGNYWIANISGQLFIYAPLTKKISVPPKDEIHQNSIRCLVSDIKNNCMWIGTSGYGLIKYYFNNNKFEYIETNNKIKTALHSYVINDIVPDGKGNIWVATFEGGLAKYNTSLTPDKGFTNYDISTGLPDDNIYSVASDGKGSVWFTTINGIGHIGADDVWKGLYNRQSGLPYSKFQQSIAVMPDGQVATVVDNNFICFNPSAINTSNNYPVKMDDIYINDTIAVANNRTGKLQKFNYEQNVFSFNFSVLDFISPGAVEYYYMLAGLEKDWVFAGKQHSIRYSKLPPGEYTFKVKAKIGNGDFYPQAASFHFYIMPPFWKTWWFICLMVLVSLLLLYGFIKWRIKGIKSVEAEKLKVQQLNAEQYKNKLELEQIVNYFSSSLIDKNNVDDVLWDVAKNLIGRLGFVDCMIYLWNSDKTKMIQRAGYGPKGSIEEIEKNLFDVSSGEGVVGYVMQTKEQVLVTDTSKDARYRVDDMERLSEICVPIIYNDELIGVIDSEHHNKNFFNQQHTQVLNTIAALMANKIKSIESEQSLQGAKMEMMGINEKLSAAKLEALQSQLNPHFIFNCLNSIDNLIQNNEKEKATLYLSKFAKLMRSILETSKHNAVPCWKDMETMKVYLELEELRLDKKFTYQIDIDEKITNGDYKVPPLVIQPFVENAIHHGLLNKTETDRKLFITVSVTQNHIQYTIQDNGVGRAKAAAYKQLNKPTHESMGMQITTDRINLFNRNNNGSVKITDLYDKQDQPAGTKVEIELINQ